MIILLNLFKVGARAAKINFFVVSVTRVVYFHVNVTCFAANHSKFNSHYCPRRDFAQKAKSRGVTLVTRAYIKESTYSRNIQSYSQYRKNLDLLEQGPRGIGR